MKKTIAAILALILGLSPILGYSQNKPDVKGFDQTVFDYHFSRADRELSPDRWVSEAWRGYGLAINAWELISAELYDNPLAFDSARKQVEDWGAAELEERFSRWLCNRFFGSASESSVQNTALFVSDTQKQFTFHLDENGKILHEESTGDPSVIRPGEEGREFLPELTQWRLRISQNNMAEAASYEVSLARLYPELLAFIPENQRASFNEKIASAGSAAAFTLRREFEEIAAREERIFISRRTGDIFSLRKKSDDEAARAITTQLIAQTEERCALGIADLTQRIEEAQAGTGDLALMGSEWLEMYRQQFERGLKAWEEAEERFFIRRIEWEQDAGRLFSEGEEAWLSAFKQIENERIKWELKTKELFESGDSLFRKASETLERAITEAKVEFELMIQTRVDAGASKFKALVDMYLLCAGTACQSWENVQFWLQQIVDVPEITDIPGITEILNIPGISEIINTSDLTNILGIIDTLPLGLGNNSVILMFKNIIEGIVQLSAQNKEYEDEAKKSMDMYNSYFQKAQETRELIMNEYSFIIGSGQLKDILDKDAASEDFCLDEYQLALAKAKALVLYWEKQSAIAQAVSDYASDVSAGRETRAESIMAWESAKAYYEDAVLLYERELQKLNQMGSDVQDKQIRLDKLARAMSEAEEELNRMNREYSALVSVSVFNKDNSTKNQLNLRYATLLEQYKILYQPEGQTVYHDYLDALLQIDALQTYETASYIYKFLIDGNGHDLLPLAFLQQAYNSMLTIGSGDELPENAAGFGISPDNSLYVLIDYLFTERDALIKENNDPAAVNNCNALIRAVANFARSSAETELKVRLAGINLFADSPNSGLRTGQDFSGTDWYYQALGLTPDDAEKLELSGDKIKEQLVTDAKYYSEQFFQRRIEIEISALSYLLDGNSCGFDEAEILSGFCLIENDFYKKAFDALVFLWDNYEQNGSLPLSGYEETDRIIRWFFSGGSFFIGVEAFCIEEIAQYELCQGLLEQISNFGTISSFWAKEAWHETLCNLVNLFAGYDLELNGQFLPNINDIRQAIFNKAGDFSETAARFLYEFDQAAMSLPDIIYEELNSWKNVLIENIVYYALVNDIQPLGASLNFEEMQNKINSRYTELEEYVNSISEYDEATIAVINQMYWDIAHDQAIWHYQYLISQYYQDGKDNEDKAAHNDTKHWRQYIGVEYITDIDENIFGALSWIKGAWLDVLDNAAFYDGYINELFYMFSPEYGDVDASIETLVEKYYEASEKWQYHTENAEFLKSEIVRLGLTCDYLMMDKETIKIELGKKEQGLKEQEKIFDEKKDIYLLASKDFANIGANYDTQYTLVKEYFNYMEENRFEYEKQDAIRRWASTAYLQAENDDVKECKEKLIRAQIVLDVLSNLYNDEEERPYNNPQYAALYAEYEQSFSRMIRSLKAYDAVNSGIAAEITKNNQTYANYMNELSKLGFVPELENAIMVKDGLLCFIKDESKETESLSDYFKQNDLVGSERHKTSNYEIALWELSQRLDKYFKNTSKMEYWGLARNYLLLELSKTSSLEFLNEYVYHADQLEEGNRLGDLLYKKTVFGKKVNLYEYYSTAKADAEQLQEQAYGYLSDAEKADLEFFTILTLMQDSKSGFLQQTAYSEYQNAYHYMENIGTVAAFHTAFWFVDPVGALFDIERRDMAKNVMDNIKIPMNQTKDYINKWKNSLKTIIANIKKYKLEYIESCNRLEELMGKKSEESNIGWEDIYDQLINTELFNSGELITLKNDWEEMLADIGGTYSSAAEGLGKLYQWSTSLRDKSKRMLESQWVKDSNAQKSSEAELLKIIDRFINGDADKAALQELVINAYGKEVAAWKKHYKNMEKAMRNDLNSILDYGNNYSLLYSALADEYAELITQSLEQRYSEELLLRQNEWGMQCMDLIEKYNDWQKTAMSIVERGRLDWKYGTESMQDAYSRWFFNFLQEYQKTSEAWAQAYLAGLNDKEEWLAHAERAANDASEAAFADMIGAERKAYAMDERNPLGMNVQDAKEEAAITLNNLLNAPGITNLTDAFSSLNGSASLVQTNVRRGVGNGIWDAGIVRAAASELARQANRELAERESKKLALRVNELADDALKELAANVDAANKNFNDSMDDMFIMQGQWRKSGENYSKNIMVYSTFFEPVITEEKKVPMYKYFEMDSVNLTANMDEVNLANLDSNTIDRIIDSIYLEIETIAAEIFGTEEEKKLQSSSENNRSSSPGKFGKHIGYGPSKTEEYWKYSKREGIFNDEGEGQLGRLLSDYIFWSILDNQGLTMLSTAAWDKPMWDDRDSFFNAPSLRDALDLAVGIVAAVVIPGAGLGFWGAIAVSTAITSADDLLFGCLDVAGGYKTIGEAGFEFGKTVLMNFATSTVSGVFNGVEGVGGLFKEGSGLTKMWTDNVKNGVAKWSIKVGMAGVETLTSGVINSAISGITYNDEKLGYDWGVFKAGCDSAWKGSVVSMSNSFVTGGLGLLNNGIDGSKLKEFSILNQENVGKLNGLLGELSGQGINYALKGDFTLNVLNLSLLSGNNFKSGLLEMHFGHDKENWFSMKFGTGGANVSPDTIAASIQGALVWNVNNKIDKYTSTAAFKEKASLRGLYGFGDGNQKQFLFDLFSDKADIWTQEGQDYMAQTTMLNNGRKIVTLGNYQPGMNMEDQLFYSVLLGHEAYRDGVYTDYNNTETRQAVLKHTEMALRMMNEGIKFTNNESLMKDIVAYCNDKIGVSSFNDYVDRNYDSSADYWKLTANGSLEYDGYASLRDANNILILSFKKMGLANDNSIEGALLYLLNIDKNDAEKVSAVRAMMEEAGLKHTPDANPDKWVWKGDGPKILDGGFADYPMFVKSGLTIDNMGKTISISQMSQLFTNIGASGADINKSIGRIYFSPIDFLIRADTSSNSSIASSMLSSYYNESQMNMILANKDLFIDWQRNGINVLGMGMGVPEVTTKFGVDTGDLKLKSSSVTGAAFFQEIHTGIDLAGSITGIMLPGGYWELYSIDEHKAYFKLYGSDLKMRIQHLDKEDLQKVQKTIYDSSIGKVLDYPKSSEGTGTGTHIHIDFTMNLPYNDSYTRQFLNPSTLTPGNRLEYSYAYKDAEKNNILGKYGNFWRY